MSKQKASLQQYRAVTINSDVDAASPHRLIQMLLQGATDKISMARAAISRGDKAAKANCISSAHAIIEGLQVSLDKEKGLDIADNLDALYDYSSRRLVEANLNDDTEILQEILDLLGNIRSAWDEISVQQPSSEPSTAHQSGISIGV